MKVYYIPCFSGDYRLEIDPKDSGHAILSVVNPTATEKKVLREFLADARKLGWIDDMDGIMPAGESRLRIKATVTVAGPMLAARAHKDTDVPLWTAVRSVSGKVRIVTGLNPVGDNAPQLEDSANTPAAAHDEPVAAAVVRQPRTGCPAPEPCNLRASDALRTFSDSDQWAEWMKYGSMTVIGNQTGNAYRLYHRGEAARRGFSHVLLDYQGHEVCVWDDTVPAEEEALGIKLMLEHRETERHTVIGGRMALPLWGL